MVEFWSAPLLRQANGLQERVSVAELRWGDSVAALRAPFDVVLASDLIYEQPQLPALAETLAALIAPAAGQGTSTDALCGQWPDALPARAPGRVLLAYERRPLVVERAFAEFARVGLVAERVRARLGDLLA